MTSIAVREQNADTMLAQFVRSGRQQCWKGSGFKITSLLW